MTTFDINSFPNQRDRVAIVTGANAGLGYETTLALAAEGIKVVMACRNMEKANIAKNNILKIYPSARLACMSVDLAKLSSVHEFASLFLAEYSRLDLLINNAGIMGPPYATTEDGYESQLATNYFGHFLLTHLLLETLEATEGARIVTVSSLAHKWGEIYFDDLHFELGYNARRAYGQSKLACLMFSYELARQLKKHGYQTISAAAHPGIAITQLNQHLPLLMRIMTYIFAPFMFQPAKKGAAPILHAALAEGVKSGEYYGPGGFKEFKGSPVQVDSNASSKNLENAKRLWDLSQKLTGALYFERSEKSVGV